MTSSASRRAHKRFPGPGRCVRAVAATVVAVSAVPATAQSAQTEQYSSAFPIPPGAMIYGRDVPTRQAQLPGEPGRPDFVDAGPDEILLSSLTSSLARLSDEEAGSIAAPMSGPTSGIQSLVGGSVEAPLTGDSQSSQRGLGLGGGSDRGLGDAIGRAGSALGDVLASIPTLVAGPR